MNWEQQKAQIVSLLRANGNRKIKINFLMFRWTIKFSVLADQIEQYT